MASWEGLLEQPVQLERRTMAGQQQE